MPEIPTTCEFQISTDEIILSTKTNGDKIICRRMHLGEAAAAALAYMINTDGDLTVRIRKS